MGFEFKIFNLKKNSIFKTDVWVSSVHIWTFWSYFDFTHKHYFIM